MSETIMSFENIKNQIEKLPKGNITYKTIRGKRRMYLQWTEDGEKKSKYIKAEDEAITEKLIKYRKELEQELKAMTYRNAIMATEPGENAFYVAEDPVPYGQTDPKEEKSGYELRVVTGTSLNAMCNNVRSYGKRDCFNALSSYLQDAPYGKVCLIYGLRRTGKTTLVLQAIAELPLSKTAYIKALSTDNMAMLNRDLKRLAESGFKYVFIDEITLMADFIDSASLLSDVYAMMGIKIVLSGTDSLGLMLSTDDELYDRSYTIHTTFIPFREYSSLLGIHDIDEYIRYGGTFRIGETDFDDKELMDEGVSFRDDESARRYIDTAIARNIQHSLAFYKAGGRFRHLTDLYEADELTGAINRIIEDMNHRFLLSVLERDFVSHDFGSSRQIERKKAAMRGEESVLDTVDDKKIFSDLRKILNVKNSDERQVKLSEDHVREIKEYLFMLDLIVDCPCETIGGITPIEHVLFCQPGMRYCQAQALVFSLMKDEIIKKLPATRRREIGEAILEEVRGRMLEEIVLLETVKRLPRGKRAFKLLFDKGEFDMVIADEKNYTCRIFEIKHSDHVTEEQYKHLIDDEKCNKTEFEYGEIVEKVVLYRGKNTEVNGIRYINVTEFLERPDGF